MQTASYRYKLEEVEDQPEHYRLVVTSLQQEGWSMPLMMTWKDVELLYEYLGLIRRRTTARLAVECTDARQYLAIDETC